jgi:hypothetical protein
VLHYTLVTPSGPGAESFYLRILGQMSCGVTSVSTCLLRLGTLGGMVILHVWAFVHLVSHFHFVRSDKTGLQWRIYIINYVVIILLILILGHVSVVSRACLMGWVLRWVGGVCQIRPSVACAAVRFLRGRRQRVKAHDSTSRGINDIVHCNVKI